MNVIKRVEFSPESSYWVWGAELYMSGGSNFLFYLYLFKSEMLKKVRKWFEKSGA